MAEREPRPEPYDRVVEDLRHFEQWVNWRMDEDKGKIPVNPHTLGNAGVRWPTTWASFDVVLEAARSRNVGIGFVLTADDPYTCVDLDDCVDEHCQVSDETRAILDLLSGWVELSPSGRGLHIWVRNEQPLSRRTKGIEIYSDARWMTVTGRSNPQAPLDIPDRTLEVTSLVEQYFPTKESRFVAPAVTLDDGEIWQQLFNSKNGGFYRRLHAGDISVCQHDHSRAVIVLANQLAILTDCDAERMKRLLHQTGLVRPKWQERRGRITWIDYQIQDAVLYTADCQP